MDWTEAFQKHLEMLGDCWVDDKEMHQLPIKDEEQRCVGNKKQALQEQGAEIEHVLVRAEKTALETKREDLILDYTLHSQWLIKLKDDFYLEERNELRRAVIRENRLVADQLIPLGTDHEIISSRETAYEPPLSSRSRKYDRLKAVRYADLWWNRRNPQYPMVLDDCTNFISQCLHAGGIQMWGEPIRSRGWWQQQTNWSFSWTVANSLRWYLSRDKSVIGALEKSSADQLVPGDVICYDFEGDGHWNHNTIVTAMDPAGFPLVNAHTYDARHRSWAYTDSPAYTKQIKYKFFHIQDEL
ncbi:amidase domain-containing protein [Sporolactobacillus kofuensis]|uniref:Amidase domain-containing protein n=1 Tax=Sporolactobacillus kofuensis TaxID=269672 RepID=A0ABW1WIH7_9BACL|nr:amidase domain-containing protein [Sporolactobacillus kofuensis]MCO7176885.1 amidase domain-containing protein [Sporolactobacillus kofuensis]